MNKPRVAIIIEAIDAVEEVGPDRLRIHIQDGWFEVEGNYENVMGRLGQLQFRSFLELKISDEQT